MKYQASLIHIYAVARHSEPAMSITFRFYIKLQRATEADTIESNSIDPGTVDVE